MPVSGNSKAIIRKTQTVGNSTETVIISSMNKLNKEKGKKEGRDRKSLN